MAVQQVSSTREVFTSSPQTLGPPEVHDGPPQVPQGRDSSTDSGIHPPSNLSDTDSEILEAFSSKSHPLAVTPPSDLGGLRLSCHESDNLVEEVYLVQHSLHPVKGEQSIADKKGVEDEVYHASPYLDSEENSSNKTEIEKEDSKTNYMPLRSLKPEYVKDLSIASNGPGRHYVNQSEIVSKVTQIPISGGVATRTEVEAVVAIDIGTTYSGYAYCYSKKFDKQVHMMKKWEGGDPGLNNQKIPTTMLMTPDGEFHSFGFAARDFYHDLEPEDAKQWLYFDKFKKTLHNNPLVRRETKIIAANGRSVLALEVFSFALRYLSKLVLAELSEQGSEVRPQRVRWVLTVPAIWGPAAKQLMREAAYKAGISSSDSADSLVITLEPEAAAVWCKTLRFDQLEGKMFSKEHYMQSSQGSCFMVVDCGGGTVDVTVHKLQCPRGPLRELYKASGEPCGSLGVDDEFDRLLGSVFGFSFMTRLRHKRPAAYTELMLSFETRKRCILPSRAASLNISLPFSFIDFFQTTTGRKVEEAIKEYNQSHLTWSAQGMLRISPHLMAELFQPTIDNIVKHVEDILSAEELAGSVKCLFLVGGFAECSLLQEAIRKKLNELEIPPPIIPQGVALCVLRGAVLYGLHPQVITARKSQHTYGFGVLTTFQRGKDPLEKLVVRENREWCADVFDPLVQVNQTLHEGESVLRRYTPANPGQSVMVLHIYSTNTLNPRFVTEEGVQRVGTLKLDLSSELGREKPREILARLVFSGTELSASAMDLDTANYTDTSLTFLE